MQWIKTSERLPEEGTPVIVKRVDDTVAYDFHLDGKWYSGYNNHHFWLDESQPPTPVVQEDVKEVIDGLTEVLTSITEEKQVKHETWVETKINKAISFLAGAAHGHQGEAAGIFNWLLGYADFPVRKDGRPVFYWRTYLRKKLEQAGYSFSPEDGKVIGLSTQPLPSTIAEDLEQANPYPEKVFPDYNDKQLAGIVRIINGEGYSSDRIFGAWGRKVYQNACAKLRELLSSQPGAKNQVVAFGKGLNEMANGIRAAVIKEAIHVVGKSLIPHHNVVTPILQEIIKELMTLKPLPQPPTGVNTDVLVKSLQRIIEPIKYMRDELKEGEQLNGHYAIQLSNDPEYLKGIAREALQQFNSGKGEEQEVRK